MALETTASIINNFEVNLPTNNQGQITAEVLRTELKRLANNMRQSVEDIILVNPSDENDKTVFKRQDIKDLKLGKSIAAGVAKTAGKSLTHPGDESTFVKQKANAPGRVDHVVSNQTLMTMTTSSFDIGNTIVPLVIQGSEVEVTGSFNVKSLNQPVEIETGTGGFNVNNLLDLLANYGQTGIPTGSGDGGGVAAGDINLDGQVNVNDLLLVLAGYGNPNQVCNDQLIPPNVNHQFIGPTISICDGNTLTISNGSFCSITA